jgi:hypothetical protein
MLPLAKFWTVTGSWFIPLAMAWAYFVRTGSDEGVLVSRGYWGLLISLLVATSLLTALALYIKEARRSNSPILVPPNTSFEDDENRHRLISWMTVLVFILAIVGSLIVFGARYSTSNIHEWDAKDPLASTFFESRAKAHESSKQLAMGKRFDKKGDTINEVNEYLRYWSDGILMFAGYGFAFSIVYLALVVLGLEENKAYER